VLALAAVLAARAPLGADYDNAACRWSRACDDPGPAIDSLVHGRVGDFFQQQPIAGPVSVVLRAPFVWVSNELGGAQLDRYRVGAFACLLVLGLIGVWLASVARRRGAPWYLQLILVVAMVFNPLTSKVLFWGHPEDFVAAPLIVAGVVLAGIGSPVVAGVALGLAAATKLWAGLALFVAVAAARTDREHLVVAFGIVVAVLLGTMFIADPTVFSERFSAIGHFGSEPGTLTASGAWYAFSHQVPSVSVGLGTDGGLVFTPSHARVIDPWLAHVARAVILALVAIVVALWVRRNPLEKRSETALAVLALVYLLRATFEPGNYSYYLLPFLLALLTWEIVERVRVPIVAVVGGVMIMLLGPINARLSPSAFNAVYLLIAAAFSAYLLTVVLHPRGKAPVSVPVPAPEPEPR
jgi:hypothetical protein